MKPSEERHFVFAKIYDPIKPLARGDKYEDPLQNVLEDRGIGEVTGGGTMQDKNGTIDWIGVDILLDDLDDALEFTRATLLTLGAPKGSILEFQKDGANLVLPIHQDS